MEFLGQDLKAIYENYFKECATSIDLLEKESAGGNLLRAGRIAHQMLGASSTLGMLGLAAAFAAVGEAAADQRLPRQEWIVELRELLVLSMEAVNEVDFSPSVEGS